MMNKEIKMAAENAIAMPSVDFSYQFNLSRERVEKKIFSYLCDISKKLHKGDKKVGALIVLGRFSGQEDHIITGMRQLGSSKIEKYLNVAFGHFEADVLKIFESGDDGAIIIGENGQILGTGIYLTVHNPLLDIPDGAGTRHISGASFSTRNDIMATFTLSEETLAVRMWKNGVFVEQFHPDEPEVE